MVVAHASNLFGKEVSIRRRIANIYNKREEDFSSLREYNDYLEEVEDMTFKLVEGTDMQAIEEKIAKYQEENAEQIINSRARRAEEVARSLREHQEQPIASAPNDMLPFRPTQGGCSPKRSHVSKKTKSMVMAAEKAASNPGSTL